MGINFPNAPTLNQLYPQPPVVGLPVYKWDGEKWTAQGASATKTPVYTDGSTPMTAQLKLFGSPPVATNDAAPKNYVDATLAGTIKADGSVPMTGQLTVQTPPVNPSDAAAKSYVDAAAASSNAFRASCGRLLFSSATQLAWLPYNGDKIKIAGVWYDIPAAGITVANNAARINGTAGQTLAANTLYLVTVGFISGAPGIDFLTATTHAIDTTAGNVGTEIATGNSSRSVIGLVSTLAAGAFADLSVLSWFNRRNKCFSNSTSGAAGVQGTINFTCWGDEAIIAGFAGSITCSGPSGNNAVSWLDGAQFGYAISDTVASATYQSSHSSTLAIPMAEGVHSYAVNITVGAGATAITFNTSVLLRG